VSTKETIRVVMVLGMLALASCSKPAASAVTPMGDPTLETYPISNTQLTNCHFQNPKPSYAFGSTITPNPVICDNGSVALVAQVLTPAALPTGLNFSEGTLALTGVANEKVTNAAYDIYLENGAGYTIIKIQISIQ